MANVFGILTGIVLVLAGFVAYKNNAAFQNETTETATQKENLATSQKRYKTAQDNLAATTAKRTDVDEVVVKQTEVEAVQKKTNDDLTQEKATKSAKVTTNKTQIDGIREKTAKVGDLNELASKMRTTKVELEETTQSIVAAEAKLANLTAQNNQAEAAANVSKTKFEKFSSGQSLASLNTRIRTIYPTWGFVTLAAGNNSGVVANSTLEVVRDGSTIAKLLVTSVEANSASASIVPDSIGQDVTLMVGDRVIPSVKAPAPTKPAPKPAAPQAPAKPAAKPAAAPAVDPAAPAAAPEPGAAPAADPAVTPAPATN